MSILLDSSAWLAHLFGEPGVEQVNLLFDNADNEVNISALSIPEVYGRLKALGAEAHWEEVWERYILLFNKVLPADETVALQAMRLRAATPHRLPTIDALIAATAVVHQLTLIHRDSHFVAIPSQSLAQTQLPDK
ncbi:MAG: PIN domain-containing protein [Chloroflexota bacterium]